MPGKAVKDFTLPSTGGKTFRLSSTLGKKVVLYFYPKDNTPGCTAEGAVKFPFDLLSDAEETVCAQFGVTNSQATQRRY